MLTLLPSNTTFAGRYKVGRCIASGGMGAVYEVQHLETERLAALKVMLPHVLASESLREQFLREAKVAAKLRSDHIVDVIDAGVDHDTDMPYLVMELLEGEDLGTRLERLGPMPADETVTFLHQAATALDRVHKRSIVHRDLKPDNLFLTERDDGSPLVKILDFGIAKVVSEGYSGGPSHDGCGTPVYMAPEQFSQEHKISPATDIYALGMLAYTLLVDSPYWAKELEQGINVFVLARQAERGPREAATKRAAERGITLPPAFDAWFSKITSVDPSDRHPRATEAIRELAQVLSVPLPVPPPRTSRGSRGDRPSDPERPSFPDRLSFSDCATPNDTPTLPRVEDGAPESHVPVVSTRGSTRLSLGGDRGSMEAPPTADPTLDVTDPVPPKPRALRRAALAAGIAAAIGVALLVTARPPRSPASAATGLEQVEPAPVTSAGSAASSPMLAAPAAPSASAISVAPAPLPSGDPTSAPSAQPPPPSTSALAVQPPRQAPAKLSGEPAASTPAKKRRYTQD